MLFLEDLRVHPHHQHFLVIRTVENSNPTTLGQNFVRAPQEIMVQFFFRRFFEGMDLAPLRVHA